MPSALYPGSFDPFHLGHLSVVEQAAAIFDEVVVAVLGNSRKQSGLLPIPDRVRLARHATAHLSNVRCVSSSALTVDLARIEDVEFLVRSGHKEAGHEGTMAVMNQRLSGIRTVFAAPEARTRAISSSLVRDLIARGNIHAAIELVPPQVGRALAMLARPTG